MLLLDQLRLHRQRGMHKSKQCPLNLGVNIREGKSDNRKVVSLETRTALIPFLSFAGRSRLLGQSMLVERSVQ